MGVHTCNCITISKKIPIYVYITNLWNNVYIYYKHIKQCIFTYYKRVKPYMYTSGVLITKKMKQLGTVK